MQVTILESKIFLGFLTYLCKRCLFCVKLHCEAYIFVKENRLCCATLWNLIKDTLLRDRKRRKKAQQLAGIEPTTSRVLLCWHVLYHCATTAAPFWFCHVLVLDT